MAYYFAYLLYIVQTERKTRGNIDSCKL